MQNPAPSTGDHIRPNWQARGYSSAGTEDEAISALLNKPAVSTGINKSSIRPDGIVIRPDNELAWNIGNSGPLRHETGGLRKGEMTPTTIGFWLNPQENWDSSLGEKEITLLDLRPPHSHTGDQLDGTKGHNDYQNNMRLWFDAQNEHLVLSLNGPAIERTTDRVSTFTNDPQLSIGSDDPSTVRWDERTLGSMAPGNRQPLAPKQGTWARTALRLARWYGTRRLVPHRCDYFRPSPR